jgi:hypothetical protein
VASIEEMPRIVGELVALVRANGGVKAELD